MTTSSLHPGDDALAESAGAEAEPRRPAREPAVLEHEYDGIREFDNPLPRWWVLLFWGSIVFSLAYFVHYHLSGHGTSVAEAYEQEMRLAREERAKQSLAEAPDEASLEKLAADRELMLDAKVLFVERCAACHGNEGQGLIGPNLTDDHCLHGNGSLMDIYGVVSRGVPAKGMPAWELQLQPIEVRKLAAFVATLRGKNVPGKPPEGHPMPPRSP